MPRKRFAIISSCPKNINRIKNILRKENNDLSVIADDEKTVSELKLLQPDFVILDAASSLTDTPAFIKKVRQHIIRDITPIILIVSDPTLSTWLKFPLTDFITLPLKKDELLIRIKHLNSLTDARKTIRKQNEKLKQIISSQEKLISIIAHDLRAPIGTIKMINDAILHDKNKIRNAGVRKKVEMISDTSEEAYNLLENLLRWSQNQHGQIKIMPVKFDMHIVVREVLSLFKGYAGNKNITLHNHAVQERWVYADEDMMKTVLRNLVSNAIKFTYSGGKVDILFSENNEYLEIAVKDNGKGIRQADQKKLLKENSCSVKEGTKNEKGSGLGLILCKDFVKLNHGKFYFTSKIRKGSTFYFTVPKPG